MAPDRLLPYEYAVTDRVVDTRPLIRALVADLRRGTPAGEVAARFHETAAAFTLDACRKLRDNGGPQNVALCGGVMQNARLVARLLELLPRAGLEPHIHREVPPNDGGLSLGQTVVAAARTKS